MLRLKESSSKAGYLRLAMDSQPRAADRDTSSCSDVPAAPTVVSSSAPAATLLAPPSAGVASAAGTAGSTSSDPFPRGESAFELSRQLSSKSPLARVMSETSTEEAKSMRPKMEFKSTPRRAPRNGKGGQGGLLHPPSDGERGGAPCEQHSFLTDVTDVRQMEQGLLQLLHDFHSGKLQAFGKDCTFDKMEHVREQQERLARLHFELNAQQELCGPESEEGRQLAKDNLTKLIENLQHLSLSIEQLQSHSQGLQTDV
uniref:Coiled-coil domain-containing protein 28b n=1 Tax=Ixodes ricinus TaxID=34613 RepID=V5IGR0_IXORI